MKYICPVKRNAYYGVKCVWVPKGTIANSQGPKRLWVPKTLLTSSAGMSSSSQEKAMVLGQWMLKTYDWRSISFLYAH